MQAGQYLFTIGILNLMTQHNVTFSLAMRKPKYANAENKSIMILNR